MMSSMKLHAVHKTHSGAHEGEDARVVHLRADDTSLVVSFDHLGLPGVLHWGAGVNDADIEGLLTTSRPAVMNSSLDTPRAFSLLATRQQGWSGTPSIVLGIDARPIETFRCHRVEHVARSAVFVLRDHEDRVEVRSELSMDTGAVLRARTQVTNISATEVIDVSAVRLMLPLPHRATEYLDFTGRWTGERRPQRSLLHDGTWLRSSRRGRPGHDGSFVTIAGTPGFGFRTGEVWASHLGWSGNQESVLERLPEGAGVHSSVLGSAELLEPGEVRLEPGQSYSTPTSYCAWSPAGIDGATERFHSSLRARPQHPGTVRPLVLNTWEAVYFDHDPVGLESLAETAASIGVERFVLDDGWFVGRKDDTAGLGDWFVDTERWPDGLRPFSHRIHELGMQFGLWFEPEMINEDSDLARSHPEWLLKEGDAMEWRHQFALDFGRPDVRTYIIERMDAIIGDAVVDFVKWDHNRDLHASLSSDDRRSVRAHTLGVYSVIDELKRRHPALEIETCASGGARADLGILSRTDRVWASDSNDPIERQGIQRWTQVLLPPELIGSHVGPEIAHTTHRRADFSFRAITALFGHAGIEWDISQCSPDDLADLARWASLYKELRHVLHHGRTVRADHVDDGALLHGVVAHDGREAVFAWVRVATSSTAHTPRVGIPGLDPQALYDVRVRSEVGVARRHQVADPTWLSDAGRIQLTGSALSLGVPLPILNPGQGIVLHLTAVPRSGA